MCCLRHGVFCFRREMFSVILESGLIALQALWANKLRLILTMVGIIVGVGTVIVIASLGVAGKMQMEKFFSGFGLNTLTVYGISHEPGGRSKVSFSDANAIVSHIPGIKRVVPEPGYAAGIIYHDRNWSKTVTGTLPEYLEAHNMSLKYGRFIADADLSNLNKVVVLGTEPARILFDDSNPVGQLVRINNIYFRVIGVCSFPMEGISELREVVIIPLSTARMYFARPNDEDLSTLQIEAENQEIVATVEKGVAELLRSKHAISSGQRDDFIIHNSAGMIQSSGEQLKRITLFLTGIAALSLFVGGVGIMNILLISVTQRTREIGIRKALGANYRDILTQFLIEALVISAVGAVLGVVSGLAVTCVVDVLLKLPVVFSLKAIIAAVGTAMAIGLLFGIWPAHRAALLDPVEALRYEG